MSLVYNILTFFVGICVGSTARNNGMLQCSGQVVKGNIIHVVQYVYIHVHVIVGLQFSRTAQTINISSTIRTFKSFCCINHILLNQYLRVFLEHLKLD